MDDADSEGMPSGPTVDENMRIDAVVGGGSGGEAGGSEPRGPPATVTATLEQGLKGVGAGDGHEG